MSHTHTHVCIMSVQIITAIEQVANYREANHNPKKSQRTHIKSSPFLP